MWFLFALLSSVFAALTSILAKVGIEGVNSNLATAVRTVVVVIMAWVVVFMTNTQSGLPDIGRKSWIFLILSGLATGASWICYYKVEIPLEITANDLVLALNEAYGLGMDTDNIFSCYQYKVIFSNRTVYKEFEIAA